MNKSEHQKKYLIQNLFVWIKYISIGFVFLGTILDSLSSAFNLVTISLSIWFTLFILIGYFAFLIIVRKNGIPWITNNSPTVIRKVKPLHFAYLIGALLLLWGPHLFKFEETDPISNHHIEPYFSIKDTSSFNILILNYENYISDENSSCIGRSVKKNLISQNISNSAHNIQIVYADNLFSPEDPASAKSMQIYHNADLLLYGISQLNNGCEGKVCSRYSISDSIIANSTVVQIESVHHRLTYDSTSAEKIELEGLRISSESFKNWISALVALKFQEKNDFFLALDIRLNNKSASDIDKITVLLDLGSQYFNKGDYKSAVICFNKIITLHIESDINYSNRDDLYDDIMKIKGRKSISTNYDFRNPINSRLIVMSAENKSGITNLIPNPTNHHQKFNLGFRHLIGLYHAYLLKGVALKKQNRLNEVDAFNSFYSLLEIGLEDFTDNFNVYYEIAELQKNFGMFENALEYCDAAIDIEKGILPSIKLPTKRKHKINPPIPKRPTPILNDSLTNDTKQNQILSKSDIHICKSNLLKSEILKSLNRHKESLKSLFKARDECPQLWEVQTKLIDYYSESGDTTSLLSIYGEMDSSQVDNGVFSFLRGNIFRSRGEQGQARAEFDKSISKDSNFYMAYLQKAESLIDNNDFRNALNTLNKIKIDPSNAVFVANRKAYVLLRSNRFKEALRVCNEGLKYDSKANTLLAKRAQAYLSLRKYKKCLYSINQINRIDSLSDFNLRQVLPVKGIAELKLKKWNEALDSFNALISRDSTSSSYYLNRGFAFSKLRNYNHAIRDYLKSLELESSISRRSIIYSNIGITYYKLENNQEADKYLAWAKTLDKKNPKIHLNIAYVSIQSNSFKKALISFFEAMKYWKWSWAVLILILIMVPLTLILSRNYKKRKAV